MKRYKTVCHQDGTVSYWSTYLQQRIKRSWHVPTDDLSAMSRKERTKVLLHLNQYNPSLGVEKE